MTPTKVEIVRRDDDSKLTVVRFAGALDTASVKKIHKVLDEVVENHPPLVVAEMSGVTLFASSALGSFMGYRTRMAEKGGDLVFAGLGIDIKAKLNQLGAGRIFKIYNDLQSAINAYKWDHECVSQSVSLSFPPELVFVPAVRQLVSRIARQKSYSNRDSFRIETIVDEVCNNAVEHGDKKVGRNIDLRLTIDRERVEIQVVNATNPDKIDILRKHSQDLGHPGSGAGLLDAKRGRGLALVKMLSTELDINLSNGGTSVRVTRRRGD